MKNVYRFYGLRRSGNHAILEWLIQNMGEPKPRNIIKPARIIQSDRAVYINEINTYPSHKDLELDALFCIKAFDHIVLTHEDVSTEYVLIKGDTQIVILRDLPNLIASRYKKCLEYGHHWTESRLMPINEHIIDLWKEHAQTTGHLILFEKWIESKTYRDQIAAQLGLPNHDITDTITQFGDGSSFSGQKVPTKNELTSRVQQVQLPESILNLIKQPQIQEIRANLGFI